MSVLFQHASRLSLLLAAFGAPAAAAAQASPAPDGAVEQIVITAQRRAEPLQDVPIVVTAVGGDLIRKAGVADVRDLPLLAPGLTVTATTSESSLTARLRGIGTVGDNPGLESSVGVVIDGVYRPRNGVALGDLGETQRIEVLKGPQNTLFGKSTSAGVINIITAGPSFEPSAGWEATVGSYGTLGGSAWINGPISGETLAGRLFVARRKRDGFLDVMTGAGPRTKTRDVDQDLWTARGQLLLKDERVSLRLIADYSTRDENCCLSVQISRGSVAASRANLVEAVRPGALAAIPAPFERIAYANRDSTTEVEDLGLSAQLDVDLGRATLTSITAVRRWDTARGQDSDFTTADLVYRPVGGFRDAFSTFTQEAHLRGASARLDWLVGGFFAQEDYKGQSPVLYGQDYYAYWAARVLGGAPALAGLLPANTFRPGEGQNDRFAQDNTSWAVFTNDTFSLTDAWDVTVGVRYSVDDKVLTSHFSTTSGSCAAGRAAYPALARAVGAAGAANVVTGLCLPWEIEAMDALSGVQQRRDRKWSGTLKSSYRWRPGLMTYVSYSRGFKPGGFNFDRPNARLTFSASSADLTIAPGTGFAAETVDAWEAGAKSEWLGRRLALNLALFRQTYRDFQLNSFVGTQFVVESIPEVVSQGADFDFRWRTPVRGLSMQGGVTYAVTEISPFTAADLQVPANFAGFARLPGARLSFAPLWSGSLAVDYERSLGGSGLRARFNVSGRFSGDYNTGSDLAPQKRQPGYSVVNARVGLSGRAWTLDAWASNLFDADYRQVAINSPLQGTESDPVAIRTYNAFLAPPRTYGLTLRVSY